MRGGLYGRGMSYCCMLKVKAMPGHMARCCLLLPALQSTRQPCCVPSLYLRFL